MPSSKVVAILALLVKENGWNKKTQVIRMMLQRLPHLGKTTTCSTLLDLLDVLLTITSASQDDSGCVGSFLQETLANFEQATAQIQSPCTKSKSYHKSIQQQDAQPAAICERIIVLASSHSGNHIVKFVKPIFARWRKVQKYSVDHLAEEILAMRKLAHQVPALEMYDLRLAMMEDFVSIMNQKSKTTSSSTAQYSQSYRAGTTWKNQKISVIIQELISYGTPHIFEQVEIWASSASCADLLDADSIFQNINSSHIASEHVAAKDKCVMLIHSCSRKLMVADYQKQVSELQLATQHGKPVFSWRMPNARTGCTALDQFLRSTNKGPTEITVGGGINYARSLARGRPQYGYSGNTSSQRGIHITKGYSAEITVTSKTGANASVIVNKTQQWYNEMVQVYETNMKKLSAAQIKLRQLRKNPSQPLVSQPPAKRSRIDTDVIVID